MTLLTKIKNKIEEIKCKNLTDEFFNELYERKSVNMQVTLEAIAQYLVREQEKETGLLYSPYDDFIQCQVQTLFWEWKKEGIINQLEELNETTQAWIFEA